ncbi:MAG: FAD-binding oxidoreductase [Thermodesulfobacteriota bacterium]
MTDSSILSDLKNQFAILKILTGKEDLITYGTDWTKEFITDPLAIIFPETVQDVRKIVVYANENKLPLVPSGGRTGLSAGATATNKELVVSFDKMNKLLSFSESDQTVTVQPGITTQEIQEFAENNGLFYPIDLSSKGSSQIGGNIATNAGGIHVIRYGTTRNWVKELKVITGRGDILDLNRGLTKNATGYDIKNLFVGSEGTLGFIVEATVQLTNRPKSSSVILVAIEIIDNSLNILNSFRNCLTLNAFEFFSGSALKHLLSDNKNSFPLKDKYPYYLLIDFECDSDRELETASGVYNETVKDGLISEGVISQSSSQYNELWYFRENITESISKYLTYKNDLSVKTSRTPEFITEIKEILENEYPDFDTILFGHIGDGNVHVSILKPQNFKKEEFLNICREVNIQIYKTVAKYEGSISAEHGVGLIKRPYLMYTRSATEIQVMKDIKKIFDPNNIMNPGKIFPS